MAGRDGGDRHVNPWQITEYPHAYSSIVDWLGCCRRVIPLRAVVARYHRSFCRLEDGADITLAGLALSFIRRFWRSLVYDEGRRDAIDRCARRLHASVYRVVVLVQRPHG